MPDFLYTTRVLHVHSNLKRWCCSESHMWNSISNWTSIFTATPRSIQWGRGSVAVINLDKASPTQTRNQHLSVGIFLWYSFFLNRFFAFLKSNTAPANVLGECLFLWLSFTRLYLESKLSWNDRLNTVCTNDLCYSTLNTTDNHFMQLYLTFYKIIIHMWSFNLGYF